MYLIPIAWLYVVILVAAAEDTLVAAALTFVFWGLAPLALFLYVTNWVLGRPDGEDAKNIENALPHAAETLFAFADKGLDSAIRATRKTP